MIDLYLKAADQATMDTALAAAGAIVDAGEDVGMVAAPGVVLDRIGLDPAIPGSNPITYDTGYLANLRILGLDDTGSQAMVSALAAVTIPSPSTPIRIWAGGMVQ